MVCKFRDEPSRQKGIPSLFWPFDHLNQLVKVCQHLLINAHFVRILVLFCVQTIDVKQIAEVEQSGA